MLKVIAEKLNVQKSTQNRRKYSCSFSTLIGLSLENELEMKKQLIDYFDVVKQIISCMGVEIFQASPDLLGE